MPNSLTRIMTNRYIFAISLFFVFPSSIFTQQLTWEDVLSEAKRKNPALIKAEESLNQARLNYYRSFTNFLPQISFSLGANESGTPGSSSERNYSYGVSGYLSIFSGFSDLSNSKIKNLELKVYESRYKRALSDMIYKLKKSFIELLWAQEMVKLSEEILRRREENFKLVQFKYEAGREDKGSLLRVEADKFQAEYELAKAKRNLRIVAFQLLKEMGRDEFEIIKVTGSFSVKEPAGISTEDLVKKTPEYLIAEYNLKKSELEITTARSEFYPEISLSGSTSKSGEKWLPEEERWSVGLNLSYPIFPGGKNIYDLKIAKTNKAIYEESLRETKQQIFTNIETALNSFIDAVENLKVREKYLIASEEQSKITSEKYINGLESYYNWYNVEENFINSKKSVLNAKKEAMISEIYFKNILGVVE